MTKVTRVGCWGAGPIKFGRIFFRDCQNPEKTGFELGPFDTKAPKGPRTGSRLTSLRANFFETTRTLADLRPSRGHFRFRNQFFCIIPIAYVQLTFIAMYLLSQCIHISFQPALLQKFQVFEREKKTDREKRTILKRQSKLKFVE